MNCFTDSLLRSGYTKPMMQPFITNYEYSDESSIVSLALFIYVLELSRVSQIVTHASGKPSLIINNVLVSAVFDLWRDVF